MHYERPHTTTQMGCESHHTTTQMPHHNHTSVRIVQDLINKSGKKLDKFGLCPKSGGGQQKNTKCWTSICGVFYLIQVCFYVESWVPQRCFMNKDISKDSMWLGVWNWRISITVNVLNPVCRSKSSINAEMQIWLLESEVSLPGAGALE